MTTSKDERHMYFTLGAVFLPLAVALWLTMDNWLIAVPFLVLGVTFLAVGMASRKRPKPSENGSR